MSTEQPTVAEAAPPPTAAAVAPTPSDSAAVHIRAPRQYKPAQAAESSSSPPLEWLHRSWTVTHSTLKRDLVAYQSKGSTKVKTVSGADTAVAAGGGDLTAWNWRGSGLLKPISCPWEMIGWGERVDAEGRTEKWAVTWFAKTLFTEEGLDVYTDRREGMSEELEGLILAALATVGVEPLQQLVAKNMQKVAIDLAAKPEEAKA
ncbi:unnamed protein product [Parascedosporium putredinis]|uniref:Uncharacterized protein n=1 Tax=Parascedosporium putredinis TaxID=1442378 RepID=A0A9P1H7B4_9PEZI|nr:unnamed protein product [Parascedosporium putredinis]CAI7999507.1 unnamed protein product [Parascedosporium putredinis]